MPKGPSAAFTTLIDVAVVGKVRTRSLSRSPPAALIPRAGRTATAQFVSMEGYEREHHLSEEWLGRLDRFIAYRRILIYTVMYGGIRSRPDEQASWKRMILTQPEVVGAFSLVSGRR